MQKKSPPRDALTTYIVKNVDRELQKRASHEGVPKSLLASKMIQEGLKLEHTKNGKMATRVLIRPVDGKESEFYSFEVGQPSTKKSKKLAVRNRQQAIWYTRCLIASFEPVTEYDLRNLPNEPPPHLWVRDTEYLDEVRKLVIELRQLNQLLSEKRPIAANQSARRSAKLRKHLDTFLAGYASTLGDAAAYATMGLIACLMYQLGASNNFLAKVFQHLNIPGGRP
ncbi:MAG: hypothetical protein WDM91_04705 [Rhizomicrobium sp.]